MARLADASDSATSTHIGAAMANRSKDKNRGNRLTLSRYRQNAPVLERLGLTKQFAALPHKLRQQVLLVRVPPPAIKLHVSTTLSPATKRLATEVHSLLHTPWID